MKSKRMLSLLTAVALSSGVITTAALVTPSIVAAAETMADQHQPFFKDATISGENSGYSYLHSSEPLPAGTQFLLTDFADYGNSNNIYFRLYGRSSANPYLYVADWGVPAEGGNTTARVTVIYPDGSADIISAKITVIPPK